MATELFPHVTPFLFRQNTSHPQADDAKLNKKTQKLHVKLLNTGFCLPPIYNALPEPLLQPPPPVNVSMLLLRPQVLFPSRAHHNASAAPEKEACLSSFSKIYFYEEIHKDACIEVFKLLPYLPIFLPACLAVGLPGYPLKSIP